MNFIHVCPAMHHLQFRAGECDVEAAMYVKLGRHPGLVSYIGTCSTTSEQIILTEFAAMGALSAFFKDRREDLSLSHKLSMMRQISSAMEALTEADIVHRDLAARNVLVFDFDPANPQRTRVKVSDFGLSVSTYGRSHRTVTGNVLPFRWMSPEAIKKGRFNEASDMWAMGVTMWEILTGGDIPYAYIGNDDHVARQVCEGTLRLSQPEGCPEGLWALIKDKCWDEDPKRRPSFKELSIALTNIDGSSLYEALAERDAAERAAADRTHSQQPVSNEHFYYNMSWRSWVHKSVDIQCVKV